MSKILKPTLSSSVLLLLLAVGCNQTQDQGTSAIQSGTGSNNAATHSSCEGINLDGNYLTTVSCPVDGHLVPRGTSIALKRQGDESNCSFSASGTVIEKKVKYSITPPPGVLQGPYDMCALWAFDEKSRPGSFPDDMIEPCKIWSSRPADTVTNEEVPFNQKFSSSEVKLDIARRASDIGECRVRKQ